MDSPEYKTGSQFGPSPGELDFDVEDFLEESTDQEKNRLEEELERVEQQLEERDRIHSDAVNELESKVDWYTERLELLYQRSIGKHGERDRLKNRIEGFYRELRGEKREFWRDRQELEMERRELIRELDELDDSERLFDLI